ncbi:aspartate racemase [Cupriavidus sp. YR651]|uniref:aspartate/glutamate racemase family protein n=1 Tax=Cupriavidus sp. YR651 TaxID=1855315 RepID=UPI00088FE73D|nr:amino acid racemase [Cupriavidus sp. YR651]SDD02309.1 aspartate racemase [Cupriavidus sp. YR651]
MQDLTFGIIGGLGTLAGADLFLKLVKSRAVMADQGRYHFLFEQHPFRDVAVPLTRDASMTGRKLYVFKTCQSFESRTADAVLMPCFASHTFREELQAELSVRIVNMMDALGQALRDALPDGGRIGILASDYVRHARLFEAQFGERYDIVYPTDATQATLMEAMYGIDGIKAGNTEGLCLEHIHQACQELVDAGAALIVPGMTELSLVASALQRRGIAIVDVNQVYADYATSLADGQVNLVFKLGIVGGVGPAATVDFMGKVVKNTTASKDQDHIKMVVEQNPQIPDRTANLLRHEADPTVALYATCKRLESEGANAIAIPCNTAHAYVERIQPHLSVPIVNMLTETVTHIVNKYGKCTKVGLLATSGTVESRVYHDAAAGQLELVAPEPAYQEMVMDAIYGPEGVKAGYTQGHCADQLRAAISHLQGRDARVQILGCTELPLIFAQTDNFRVAEETVALVDPTDVLAKRCVQLARPGVADNDRLHQRV